MPKSSIDVVQDTPKTGLGIPVKTKKNPSLEPIHRPRNRLSALKSDGNKSKLKKNNFFIASFHGATVDLHCFLSTPFIYV